MTIPGLWEKFSEYGIEDQRLPIRVYARQFYKEKARHLRVGIDVYQWIFELTQVPSQYKGDVASIRDDKVILNFCSRIRELIKLHISFVFVFDGRYKTHKRRWGDVLYTDDDYYVEYLETNEEIQQSGLYDEPGAKIVYLIKNLLHLWNISYVQAPGEAEIELARLNDCGVIDAIISNDADGFVYGAQIILKNFSRWVADAPATQANIDRQEPEFYVTPYRMSKIEEVLGLDRDRMVFLTCINGSDFSQGISGLGITRCIALAQVGSKIESAIDFAEELKQIYVAVGKEKLLGLVPFSKNERDKKLSNLNKLLQESLARNSKTYFGRKFNGTVSFPSDYYFMIHFYPYLCPEIYAFRKYETNCVDSHPSTIRLSTLPQPNSLKLHDESIKLRRRGSLWTTVHDSRPSEDALQGDESTVAWFEKPNFREMCDIRLPVQRSTRDFLVEHLAECYMLRVIHNLDYFKNAEIFVNMYKKAQFPLKRRADEYYVPIWSEEQYQVKYNRELVFGRFLKEGELYDENYRLIDHSEQKLDSTWVPKYLLELSSHGRRLIEQYEIKATEKKSPRKSPRKSPKKSPKRQLSTLDNLLRSPIKRKLDPGKERSQSSSPLKSKPNLSYESADEDSDILESPTKRRSRLDVDVSGLRTSLFKSPDTKQNTPTIDLTTPPKEVKDTVEKNLQNTSVLFLDTTDDETDKLENDIEMFFKK
ncbi:hypothetical protein KL933_002889 [Ogataea haglerorum]|uniref:XPG-I domain-containing protein n=1 Tax=Ogataea haglerorum TaxID=1937702 RepID=A0AAN6D556_9ASCO|nr:uncharacterized protein KL911_001026 [Ogataea haglerorum]KAG7701439.1 hypothetical protein KL915_000470 [Ogataea haglerorum]KAG7727180.1 hypothetical protein KL933_002889 [Ogataea haglerorum]KAG7732928.1 hypothetical protein KL948_001431 [Ogataea haglerorum]KAG7741978.1 hypothetical protein KL923_001233 [Ogataea haglerorum]KAG7758050.1 hypothetical protein KL911_001026 [Ogataea haglerorum]